MFKNIICKLDEILNTMRDYTDNIKKLNSETKENSEYIKKINNRIFFDNQHLDIVEKQHNLIDKLITDKYIASELYECVVLVPYRGTPVVVKDGKRLGNEQMKSFCIDWAYDSRTSVTINND